MVTSDDNTISNDVLADMQTVADSLAAGKPLDSALVQRVRERSEKAKEELSRKYGVREIAVDLIREIRDEE